MTPRTLLVLAALALCAAPQTALADDAPPITGAEQPYSPYYSGAFVALGAFAGPSLTSVQSLDSAWSTAFGAWVQMSVPLQVIDLQFAYYRNDADATFSDGRNLHVGQDTLSLSAGLHPLYLAHLESNPLFYVLGGTYLLAGVDIEHVAVSFDDGEELSEFDLGLQLGGGLDVPLDNVDDGGAFWLGLQYRFNQYGFETAPLRDLDVSQHLFFIRLSYRRNGLLTAT